MAIQHLISPHITWFSQGLCPLRLAGDLCLVTSTPWLVYRLCKNGAIGISVEAQILRLTMFVARYLDLFIYGQIISEYNTYMKLTLVVTSLHVVISLVFQYKAYNFHKGKVTLLVPLAFAMFLAPLVSYAGTFVEIAWAFSQLLGIVANIPQLMLLSKPENHDWKLNVYLVLIVGYRAFYIPHWIVRLLDWGTWDPVSVFSGVSEATILLLASIGILWSYYKHPRSQIQFLEEGAIKTNGASSPILQSEMASLPEKV